MTGLSPAFTNPPLAAQACFRRLLDAMARPGTIAVLDPVAAPAPLAPAAGAVALTLCDADTRVWLDARLDVPGVRDWLRFHTGCRIVTDPTEAGFAFAAEPAAAPFDRLDAGTDEFPDRSATLVMQVASLADGTALRLEGPGIERAATLRVAGMPRGFVAWRTANRALYPRGVDVVLVAGSALAALPRSTVVTED
jgi:alpha-D-ribose 1-methylphosphonate 5-triphosphate synthase subunit PhnH